MSFESFLGNEKAMQTLRELLGRKRMPSSMLFTGPEGVGKKTLAMMLAKALNCAEPGPTGNDFCGKCEPCRKTDDFLASSAEDLARRQQTKDAHRRVEGLVYFDVQLIEPITRYILTEQIRQIRTTAYDRPFNLPRRVFIINEAQTIHWQAADLLLKVLEEPPATTTFILICPQAFELRSTIRSRCFTLQFAPVEQAVIERILDEERGFSKAQRELALRIVNGSVARARTFDLKEFLGRRKPWLDLLDLVARPRNRPLAPGDWKALFATTKSLIADSGGAEESLKIASGIILDLLQVLHEEHNPRVTHIDLLPRLKAWSRALGMPGIEKLGRGLENIHREQIRNVNQQLSLDSLASQLLLTGARL